MLSKTAQCAKTITTAGSVGETIARFTGHPEAAAGIRTFMTPVNRSASVLDAASNCWKAGKVAGDPGAASDEKMTAINNAAFSSLIAAGTLFPLTCGPMVTAGTIGLIGTKAINYLCREKSGQAGQKPDAEFSGI